MPKLGIFSSSAEQICSLLPGIYKMTPFIHSHKIFSFPIPVVGKIHSRTDWDMLLHNTYTSLWDCKELSSSWSLLILVCLFFWPRHRVCGILVPQGWNPHTLEWKHKIFTTGLPVKGHYSFFFLDFPLVLLQCCKLVILALIYWAFTLSEGVYKFSHLIHRIHWRVEMSVIIWKPRLRGSVSPRSLGFYGVEPECIPRAFWPHSLSS